jgi:oligopeptide/dipeptide ABC transporter ATP-binding protein
MVTGETILTVEGLRLHFNVRRGGRHLQVRAVDDVSLSLREREVLGIVGESGSGKTTVGRSIMRLAQPQAGRVVFRGRDVLRQGGEGLNDLRLRIRMVFQDPYASLNPRRSIGDSVAEAGDINGVFTGRADRQRRIAESLTNVGLDPSLAGRYPHELSGGQRQRVGIARAILPVPDVVIADEPVSALDVSIQAQVLNLLSDLRERLGLSMILISHDIGVIGHMSDRVAVMYMGRIVEFGEAREVIDRPSHPYTVALMAAVPKPDPSLRIAGTIAASEPPSQFDRPEGCAYAPRCPLANDRCRVEAPVLRPVGTRVVACHNALPG